MWDELHRQLLAKSDLSRARQWLAVCTSGDRPVDAMIVAASFGSIEAVDLLCEYGWSAAVANDVGMTPVMAATELGRTEMVRHLIERGVDLDTQDAHGLTALMYAAQYQHAEIVELLVQAGASPGLVDHAGWTAARHARTRGVGVRLGMVDLAGRIPCFRRTKARRILEEWNARR